MPAQFWVSTLTSPEYTADGTALANSSTLTDISPTPNLVLPANYLYVGAALRVRARGRFSTTGTPTLLVGVYYGAVAGTVIVSTGAITTASGAANVTWGLDVDIICRTIGSSGTVMGIGTFTGINAATNSVNFMPASAPATATINTTTANAVTIGAQWGTSSASNTIQCHTFTVEALN